MAYVISHFFEGGTREQYEKVVAVAHPPNGLPPGQLYHAAGPTDGGWLVVAVWDSKESMDTFASETLLPTLRNTEGGLVGPPEERAAEVVSLVTA